MAHFKVAVLLCLFGVVALSSASGLDTTYSAGGLGAYGSLGGDLGGGYGSGGGADYYEHPTYAYKYGVTDSHTGDIKDAHEQRDGGITTGGYSLLQPDGRKRIVQYTSTSHGGFNAHVSYDGHAIHPQGYQQSHEW